MNESLTPVTKNNRIRVIDVIRGMALFGVFLVNSAMFNATMLTYSSNPWKAAPGIEFISAFFIQVFGEGKAYTIFAFLFGLGFYLFITRAEEKGYQSKKLFARRLFFLLLFGILHFSLVWYGDILHTYALTGFVMLLFTKCKPRTLMIWSVVFLVLFICIMSLGAIVGTPTGSSDGFSMQSIIDMQTDLYKEGTFTQVVFFRATTEAFLAVFNNVVFGMKVLSMFLLGLYCGKRKIFENLSSNLNRVKKWFASGLVLSILLSALYLLIQSPYLIEKKGLWAFVFKASKELSIVTLALTYVTGIIILYFKGKFKSLFERFASVGQMALTNYLAQCILLALIFYPYGLGLMGQVGVSVGVLITLAFYILQMFISPIILKRWSYGPFEYIWRKLTYKNV